MQGPQSRTIERHERQSAGRGWFEPQALPAGILRGFWCPKQPSSQISMLFFGLIVSVTDRKRVLREDLERACIECARQAPPPRRGLSPIGTFLRSCLALEPAALSCVRRLRPRRNHFARRGRRLAWRRMSRAHPPRVAQNATRYPLGSRGNAGASVRRARRWRPARLARRTSGATSP